MIFLAKALVFAALGFLAGFVKGRGVGRREFTAKLFRAEQDAARAAKERT